MPKLTVYFKDKPLSSDIYESGVVHIGRDETNDIAVDSLAIAPAHAAIIIKNDGSIIKQLNENFPLIVNGEQIKEAILQDNDHIHVGKHSIVYNLTESVVSEHNGKPQDKTLDILNQKLEKSAPHIEASLQIMSGPHIGRILALKKTMTRIGNPQDGIVVVARRKNGFFVSALENPERLEVNNEPVGEKSVQLNDNDVITINNVNMQFFHTK